MPQHQTRKSCQRTRHEHQTWCGSCKPGGPTVEIANVAKQVVDQHKRDANDHAQKHQGVHVGVTQMKVCKRQSQNHHHNAAERVEDFFKTSRIIELRGSNQEILSLTLGVGGQIERENND